MTIEPDTMMTSMPAAPQEKAWTEISRLVSDLNHLGLHAGDIVFARSATTAIFPGRKGNAAALRDAILEAIGPRGTLVTPTFTASQLRPNSPRRTLFTPAAATISGGFAAAVLRHETCQRSAHPLNSIGAIGAHAGDLVAGHNERAHAHSWMGRFIEFGGKQLVVGCVASSPGLGTIHFAQNRLGLSRRSLLVGYEGTFVRRPDGREVWITRTDSPGCSLGFHRMYGTYVREGILRAGYVGQAYSIMAPAAATFALDMKALAANPRSVLCGRPECLSCSTRTYNLRALPWFVVARSVKALLGVGRLHCSRDTSRTQLSGGDGEYHERTIKSRRGDG